MLLQRAAQHFEVFQQRPAFLRQQATADYAVATTAGTEFVTAVVVAGDFGIEQKGILERTGLEAEVAL